MDRSSSSCMTCGILHPISMYAFVKPADFKFPQQKVLRLVEQQVGGDITRSWQLVNSRATEIVIYLHTYLRVSFHRSGVNSLHTHSTLVLYEQT